MREGGIFEQWRQGTLAMRSLAHLSAAVESSRGRNGRARVITYLASSASDLAIAQHAGGRDRNPTREAFLNTVDAGLWAYWARDAPEFLRTTVIATAVPSLIETGFRLGAGTAAVPVMEPSLPWRPLVRHRDGGQSGWTIDWPRARTVGAALARDGLPPLVGMAIGRRVRGGRLGFGPAGWMLFAAVGGYALARSRADAQERTTRLWQTRTASAIAEARVESRVRTALVHNSNSSVDPKSLLTQMAAAGSEPARRALSDIRSEGVDALHEFRNEGTTLFLAADRRTIVPPADRLRWVTNEQSALLRRYINEIDSKVGEREDIDTESLRVIRARGPELVVEYCGESIALSRPVPEMVIRLDPTLAAVALGMVWTATNVLPTVGGAPAWAVAPALGLQAAALRRVRDRPVLVSHLDQVTAGLVGGAALAIDLAVASTQKQLTSSGGLSLCPGTGATQPLAVLLAAGWRHLGWERWALAGMGAVGFALAFRLPGHRSFASLVEQVAFVLMPAAAAATVGADAAREAYALDNHLDDQLAADVEHAARVTARLELDDYLRQLQVVVDDLGLLHRDLTADQISRTLARYGREIERIRTLDPLQVISW